MLDVFKDKQPLFYEEITNCINNDRISHAYLIETNNYLESNEIVLEFVKEIFNYYDKDNISNILSLIENDALDDLVIINPDGAWIKKDQVLDMKSLFKTSSTGNRPRIYIINEADKLNKFAANSLLKFLEEPEGNIIAILVTENRYKVLETIRSRCQLYSLVNIDKNDNSLDMDNILKVVETLEKYNLNSIAYLPIALENDMGNREYWVNTITGMINIYESSIRKIENLKYNDYGDILDLIIKNNKIDNILNKVSVLFKTLSALEYNLNINMMLDKFIIEFAGGSL